MAARKRNLTGRSVLMSLFGFVILWAVVTDAWGYSSHVAARYGNYIYAVLSRLIWVTPAIWLILRHSALLSIGKRELFSRPVWNKSLIIILIVSLFVSFIGMFATHGGFWLNPTVNIPLEITKICFVGFVEETVFRGWGYNAMTEVVTNRKAIIQRYSSCCSIRQHILSDSTALELWILQHGWLRVLPLLFGVWQAAGF